MYTSGTTGKPKGVMLSQGNVLGSASAMFTRITSFDNPMTSEGNQAKKHASNNL